MIGIIKVLNALATSLKRAPKRLTWAIKNP